MGNSKIGSPFTFATGQRVVEWDGERVTISPSGSMPMVSGLAAIAIKAAIEAWTPKPPEGWERCPEGDAVGGLWCEATGQVYDKISDGARAALEGFGCVPVRKVKPAVPEWAVSLAEMWPNGMTTDQRARYFAENFVSKADADEMLDALKDACNTLLEYPSKDNIRRKCNALIERMEGKR